MGWVTLSLRNQSILRQKINFEHQLMNINHKLMALQSYASNVTNGVMCTGRPGWLNVPGVTSPYEIAKMQTDKFIKQHGMFDPKTGAYYLMNNKKMTPLSPQKVFLDFLHKASCEYLDRLRHQLHRIEREMVHQRDQLNLKIQMLSAEYAANEKAISDSIKQSTPRYV